jgi:hypothetical protein
VKIYNYLQCEQQENMNLMFYDFNNSSASMCGQSQANNTAQNFYNPNASEKQGTAAEQQIPINNFRGGERVPTRERGVGDRVPTRDRGYRSANLNYRRRGQTSSDQRLLNNNEQMPQSGL